MIRLGCEGWFVVRKGQERHPARSVRRSCGKEGRSRGFLPVEAGPCMPDAGYIQVFHSVEKTPFLEIERVVVGQGADVNAGRF